MSRGRACLLTCVAALSLLVGCDGKPAAPQSNLATTQMAVGRKTYTLEIARTEAERNKGLMERDSMPDDHGMIFLFREAREQSFWMKHTRIPLDIVYVGADGKVVSVHHMDPYKLDSVPSDGPAQFAIELNAGQAAVAEVRAGHTVDVPDALRKLHADP